MVERPSTEIRLELIEARLRAQEVALHWLFKAISSIDPGSGRAVLLALEVLELEKRSRPGYSAVVLAVLEVLGRGGARPRVVLNRAAASVANAAQRG